MKFEMFGLVPPSNEFEKKPHNKLDTSDLETIQKGLSRTIEKAKQRELTPEEEILLRNVQNKLEGIQLEKTITDAERDDLASEIFAGKHNDPEILQ
ncbi:MAG: hypothetical protein JWN89_709 [Parcubacteria group bacterium]|nr:hypothetical protein [Parcubacteria group bacterium]